MTGPSLRRHQPPFRADHVGSLLRVTDRVWLGEPIFSGAFSFLAETVRQAAPDLTAKLTIPSPSWG